MKLLHKKSQCCGVKIIRFGGKRRQCSACKKTWRIHLAKKGRKSFRKQYGLLKKVFVYGFSVRQLAMRSGLSVDSVYKRFAKNLDEAASLKRIIRIRGQKLILLIDAQWQYFKGNLWTLYFLSVKPVNQETVVVFDPILRLGKEHGTAWNDAIKQLPLSIRKRIIAVISDGIKGIETIALNNGWIIQRCHFHLLSMLQKMRGKKASTTGRLIREETYQLVRQALSEKSTHKLNTICKRLTVLTKDNLCPKKMRMVTKDFLRRLPQFRNYLKYPDLNLPTTINVMESINSFVRKKAITVNSPKSWHKWAIACIRFKPKFNCK